MLYFKPHRSLLIALLIVSGGFMPIVRADAIVRYSVEQTNTDGSMNSMQIPPPDLAVVNTVIMFPTVDYTLDLSAAQPDPTVLQAKANLQINFTDAGGRATWFSIASNASAESSIVDNATVVGVPGELGGSLQFQWAVTGLTQLQLDNQGDTAMQVTTMSAQTRLESAIPGYQQTLLDVSLSAPDDVNKVATDTSETLLFNIPWTAGTQLDVFFDLTSELAFSADNIEDLGFSAILESDFANTATLTGVAIFDENDQRLPQARLVSTSGFEYPVAVPEPSAWALLCGASIGLAAFRAGRSVIRRRRKR